MSKAITEKQDDQGPGRGWGPGIETAPSVMRADEPTIARTFGLVGASCVIFGGIALLLNVTGQTDRVGIFMASVILALGVVGLLSHAAYDRELQIRRLYWGGGLALLAVGVFLCLLPFDGGVGGLSGVGVPCFALALLFLLATQHHETDVGIRDFTRLVLLGAGVAGGFAAFIVSQFLDVPYLIPYGALAGVLGLAYLAAYVGQVGLADDRGYRTAYGMGVLGLAGVIVGLLRIEPSIGGGLLLALIGIGLLWYAWRLGFYFPAARIPVALLGLTVVVLSQLQAWGNIAIFGELQLPLVPWGLMYISLGLLYLVVSIAICSDLPLVVLMRRELSAFFFSPLIYLILVGLTVVAWFSYQEFVGIVIQVRLPEPIISFYLWGLWPILTVSFIVPVLTMKLLSEEKRSGSLEVLLTAPVNEATVVLGKFLAAFVLFMLLWAPWWLFLVALRVGGGVSFDYRPLFSFLVVLSLTGASFIAMGLFFSSLTRNQVASAVLTFAGMMLFLGVFLLNRTIARDNPNSAWLVVIKHIDYVELWSRALDGILVPKFLLFHASATVVWLFLTVKVLDARRWA